MKKTLNLIKTILVWVIAIFAVCMMIFTIISVRTFDHTNRTLFGYKAFIVLSDSMSATDFNAGDLVLVKEVDPSTLKEGDIISYQSENAENYGDVVTHKIRKLTTDENGEPGFITYGTTTNTDDEDIVTYDFVIGKYQRKLTGVGKFFQFLKTTPGYILCIFLPFFILILTQGIHSFQLFQQYRREQLDELSIERKKLEDERKESQRIMMELMKLKEEISNVNTTKSNATSEDISLDDSETKE